MSGSHAPATDFSAQDTSRSRVSDQLDFSEADPGLRESVVQSVPDGADRGVDAGLRMVHGEREGRVLQSVPGTPGNARARDLRRRKVDTSSGGAPVGIRSTATTVNT